MGLLQHPVEKRLSALLGARVTFESLNVSLLHGSVDATGVTVAGDDPRAPVLTIRRARADVALLGALRKEIVIRSLTIEKPVVTITRDADGRLNVPTRLLPASSGVADASATGRQTSDATSDASLSPESDGTWMFAARKVLFVDGEVHFRDASGLHLSFEQILGEVKEAGGGLELTIIVDAASRRDDPAGPVQVRMHAKAANVPDLSHWERADVTGTLDVGDSLAVRVHAPSLRPLAATLALTGTADLTSLAAFTPRGVTALDVLRSGALRGQAEVSARAGYDAEAGWRVSEFTLRLIDLTFTAAIARVSPQPKP